MMECNGNLFDIVESIIIALSAVTGAIVAVIGLSSWRKQIRGQHEYDIARRFLKSVYQVRESIAIVRGPFISTGEMVAALESAGLSVEEVRKRMDTLDTNLEVYSRRWKRVSESLSAFDLEALEAEVVWGDSIVGKCEALRKCVRGLHVLIDMHLRRDHSGGDNYGDELEKKIRDAMYSVGDDSDKNEYSKELKAAINDLEKHLRPYLRNKRSFKLAVV